MEIRTWTIATGTMPHVIGHTDDLFVFTMTGTTGEARQRLYRTVCHITPIGEVATATDGTVTLSARWDSGAGAGAGDVVITD